MTMLAFFAIPLILTIIIETSAAFLAGVRKRSDFLLIVLVNCITNPAVVYLNRLFEPFPWGFLVTYMILESTAVLTEYMICRKYLVYRHPFALICICNLFSMSGGLLWQLCR